MSSQSGTPHGPRHLGTPEDWEVEDRDTQGSVHPRSFPGEQKTRRRLGTDGPTTLPPKQLADGHIQVEGTPSKRFDGEVNWNGA